MNSLFPKVITTLLSLSIVFPLNTEAKKKTNIVSHVDDVALSGYVAKRINDCIANRVKTQSIDEITNPFLHQDETNGRWQTEFWGKWVQGAMSLYRYTHDEDLYNMIAESVEKMKKAQLPDGYLGNYDKAHQLGGWDVWGRKYCSLGLIKWYDLTGDKEALQAVCKLIDYTIDQIGPGKTHVFDTGNYMGMASGSILEPVVFLYKRTLNPKYLDFAKHLVNDMELEGGPQLLKKKDVPVFKRSFPKQYWFGKDNGQKAYEMMSCYVGMLELYKVTHDVTYLEAVETVMRHIMDEEINICGSGASIECWYNGKNRQTSPSYHTMETCVTFTWMQINERLLQITANPVYADNIETTIYNALLASMKGDGTQIAKYTPLEGFRHEGEQQCGLTINCCNANGPRAFGMIPRFTYMTRGKDSIDVNFYATSNANIQLASAGNVQIATETNYPLTNQIAMTINPEKAGSTFKLSLRIPAWSQQTELTVNGEKQAITPGTYATIERQWNKGDKIILSLDLRGRLTELNGKQALMRGPIVLARDSRFQDGCVRDAGVIQHKDGYVELQTVTSPDNMWITVTAPVVVGTDFENFSKPVQIHFCDFASAGNTWDENQRYNVWMQKTINIRKELGVK